MNQDLCLISSNSLLDIRDWVLGHFNRDAILQFEIGNNMVSLLSSLLKMHITMALKTPSQSYTGTVTIATDNKVMEKKNGFPNCEVTTVQTQQ